MSNVAPVELIVYGDFNCPFSAVASERAAQLERLGRVVVDWRAVEHAPDIPIAGNAVTGELRTELERELEQIRAVLTSDEADLLTLPTRLPNTALATAAYAAVPAGDRREVRARLFAACWRDGGHLTDALTRARLSASDVGRATARRWRDEWAALPQPIVPAMVLPDGYVSRGLGALARLRELMH